MKPISSLLVIFISMAPAASAVAASATASIVDVRPFAGGPAERCLLVRIEGEELEIFAEGLDLNSRFENYGKAYLNCGRDRTIDGSSFTPYACEFTIRPGGILASGIGGAFRGVSDPLESPAAVEMDPAGGMLVTFTREVAALIRTFSAGSKLIGVFDQNAAIRAGTGGELLPLVVK